MKTIKNMWAIDRTLTVLTMILALIELAAMFIMWWAPVNFGYPWYSILINSAATVFVVYMMRGIAKVVNN